MIAALCAGKSFDSAEHQPYVKPYPLRDRVPSTSPMPRKRDAQFWVIKGRPSRNDLDAMLVPRATQQWITRRPPATWGAGDGLFFWKGAPALRLMGVGAITRVRKPNGNGDTFFNVRYLSAPFARPLGIDSLRADRVLRSASFLKSGPGGTVFPLSSAQTRRLIELIDRANPGVLPEPRRGARVAKSSTRPAPLAADGTPLRAISIQQPFAELILRGIKTIEVRSILTHIRGRVYLYASAGRDHRDEEAKAERKHGIDVKKAQRGVIIGTVDIVDCRRVTPRDSKAAGFKIDSRSEDFGWALERPRRLRTPLVPERQPQPVFFAPFEVLP